MTIFCGFTGLYTLCLIRLARMYYETHKRVHDVLEFVLLALCLIAVPTFAILWRMGFPEAYIPEHAAYILFLLFMMVFFAYHPPDAKLCEKKLAGYPDCEGVAQCRPLLPPAGGVLEMVAVTT